MTRPLLGLLIAGAATATACAGEAPGPDSCFPLDGTYEVRFEERPGGDCGDMESVVRYEAGANLRESNNACDVEQRESADGCSLDFDQTCTVLDDDTGETLGTLRTLGQLELEPDGSSASGTWEIEASSPEGDRVCRGIGDVTIRQL